MELLRKSLCEKIDVKKTVREVIFNHDVIYKLKWHKFNCYKALRLLSQLSSKTCVAPPPSSHDDGRLEDRGKVGEKKYQNISITHRLKENERLQWRGGEWWIIYFYDQKMLSHVWDWWTGDHREINPSRDSLEWRDDRQSGSCRSSIFARTPKANFFLM